MVAAHRWIAVVLATAILLTTYSSVATAASFAVVGPPSISAAQINRDLCRRGSPLCGQGVILWQEAADAGVDPGVLYALFVLESNAATDGGLSLKLKNVGNVRGCDKWPGQCVAGYRKYATWRGGASDLAHVLATTYRRHNVYTMQAAYAPAGDCAGVGDKRVCNDPTARGRTALRLLRQWQAEDK